MCEPRRSAMLTPCWSSAGLARAAHDCPSTAGEPPHLTVTIDWDALRTGLGVATLDYGTHITATEARRSACDAKIIPVVLGGKSEPLDVGRAMRTVPLSIRRALVARDRGCVFPGCDRPPGMCQAHHRRHWVDGGETSVENCVLLCETHHRHVHHTGWEILIRHGHVEFIPPQVIDPTRTHCTTHSAARDPPRTIPPTPSLLANSFTWPRSWCRPIPSRYRASRRPVMCSAGPSGEPPIIRSIAIPPVRTNRTTSTAARIRKAMLSQVV